VRDVSCVSREFHNNCISSISDSISDSDSISSSSISRSSISDSISVVVFNRESCNHIHIYHMPYGTCHIPYATFHSPHTQHMPYTTTHRPVIGSHIGCNLQSYDHMGHIGPDHISSLLWRQGCGYHHYIYIHECRQLLITSFPSSHFLSIYIPISTLYIYPFPCKHSFCSSTCSSTLGTKHSLLMS
jgi:hypothetical protein